MKQHLKFDLFRNFPLKFVILSLSWRDNIKSSSFEVKSIEVFDSLFLLIWF